MLSVLALLLVSCSKREEYACLEQHCLNDTISDSGPTDYPGSWTQQGFLEAENRSWHRRAEVVGSTGDLHIIPCWGVIGAIVFIADSDKKNLDLLQTLIEEGWVWSKPWGTGQVDTPDHEHNVFYHRGSKGWRFRLNGRIETDTYRGAEDGISTVGLYLHSSGNICGSKTFSR